MSYRGGPVHLCILAFLSEFDGDGLGLFCINFNEPFVCPICVVCKCSVHVSASCSNGGGSNPKTCIVSELS